MPASENMKTTIDYQLDVLEKLILVDLEDNDELIPYTYKDVQDVFECSRSTAWRILQMAVGRGMLTKSYIEGKLGKKCVYKADQDYQAWFDI